jgi:hypothetical protein
MPDADVVVVLDEDGFRELRSSDDMRDFLMEQAGPVVERARLRAPKRTGRGAESIRAEPVMDSFLDEWTVRVSWTRERYYMYFHNEGTIYLPELGFLEAALEGAID